MARRRGQRKGYLYRRGPSWFLQYRVDVAELDEHGKFKRLIETKYVAPADGPGKKTKKEAERIAWEEYLSKLDQMSTRPLSSKTIAEFVKERFEVDIVWACKPSGKVHYTHMLNKHVLPALGEFRLRDIRIADVQNLIRAKREAKLSSKTIFHIRDTVRAIFRHAKKNQAYAGDLPTEGLKMPELVTEEKRTLTWTQVEALAAWIGIADDSKPRKKHAKAVDHEAGRELNEVLGALVIIMTLTGLRIGEMMGLRWRRVNLTDQIAWLDGETLPPYSLAVRENYVLGAHGTVKSKKSRRIIPLTTRALAAFAKLKYGAPDAPVFVSRNGTPLDQHNIAARYLKPAGKRKEVGAAWVSWHVLRHTHTTLADQAGLSLPERSRIMGHSTLEMTMHYSHADLELTRGKLERIN